MQKINEATKTLLRSKRLDSLTGSLALLVQENRTTSYEHLARSVGLEAGSEEFRLLLSETMTLDAEQKKPFRAALVVSSSGVPGDKFFRQAEALRKIKITDQTEFWKTEKQRLFSKENI
jgi:hypothetical protein